MSKLTYVIATRNDNHCGDPMTRLCACLRRILQYDSGSDVIIVDWGSEVETVREAVIDHLPETGRLLFINVPLDITQEFNQFNEVLALNIGIRRSESLFTARLDQDILVGEKFIDWKIHFLESSDNNAYFSTRRELIRGLFTPRPDAPLWGDWSLFAPDYFRAAVGILLAPTKLWHKVRGYDESLINRNHMEHDLCFRFAHHGGLKNLGPLINADFYHIWHPVVEGLLDNKQPSTGDLKRIAKDPLPNDEDWGMGSTNFEEDTW